MSVCCSTYTLLILSTKGLCRDYGATVHNCLHLTAIQFLEVREVGFSFISALLTVGCCSAKGPSTSLLHRPLVQSLQYLFLYAFEVFQDFYHPDYKTSCVTQSTSYSPLFFLLLQLLEHMFSAQHN